MGIALVALAARVAAIEALRGATIAGDVVVDTAALALPPSAEDKARCAIVVGADRYDGQAITLQITLSVFQRLLGPDNRVGWYVPIPSADTARVLDVLAAQVEDVLTKGESDWARAFRACMIDLPTFEFARLEGVAQCAGMLRFGAPGAVPSSVADEIEAGCESSGTMRLTFAALAGVAASPADLGLSCGITLDEVAEAEAEAAADAAEQGERAIRDALAAE